MRKKTIFLTVLLAVMFVLSSITISFADSSQCLVTRRPDSTLWVSRVSNGTPGGFFQINGLFGTQPTVIWDGDTARYYLYGTSGTTGRVWRRVLDSNCNTVGDWTALTGAGWSFDPLGAAGGGRLQNFNSVNPVDNSPTYISPTRINIKSISSYAPVGGFYVVRASGQINHSRNSATGTVFTRVFLVTSSAGSASSFIATDLPSGTPIGATTFPFSIERWFSVTGPGSRTFYTTAEEGGSAAPVTTTSARSVSMTCQFFAYAY